MNFKQKLEENLVWFVLTMIVAGVLAAFKIQDYSKAWTREAIESEAYIKKVQEWSNKEANQVVDASDQSRITGLVDKIVQNDNYRIQLIHHLDTDSRFLADFVKALKD